MVPARRKMRAPRCATSSSSVEPLPLISTSRAGPSVRASRHQLAVESPHSAGLILLSPISSVYDVANQELIYCTVLRPSQWIDNANNFENKNKIASVHIPVLIISGASDTVAFPWMPKLLYDRANRRKTLHLLEGVDHNDLWRKGDGTVVDYIRDFVSGGSAGTPAP